MDTDPITAAVVAAWRLPIWRLDCFRSDANFARRYDDEDYLRAVVRQRETEADRSRPWPFEVLPGWG